MKVKLEKYLIKNILNSFQSMNNSEKQLNNRISKLSNKKTSVLSMPEPLKLVSLTDKEKERADELELSILKIILVHYTDIDCDLIEGAGVTQIDALKYTLGKTTLSHKNDIILSAIDENQICIVKFMVDNYQLELDQEHVRLAAECGHLDMLKYLIDEMKLCADEDALIASIENQDMAMFVWLTEEKGMPVDVSGVKLTLNRAPNSELMKLCYTKNPYIEIKNTTVNLDPNLNLSLDEISLINNFEINEDLEILLGQVLNLSLDNDNTQTWN